MSKKFYSVLLLGGLLSTLFAQYAQRPALTSLSFDAREFRESFNKSADRARLVLIFSPT